MPAKKNLQELLTKSIDNIEKDRATTEKLLTDLIIFMSKTGDTAHESVGHLAAQYVETLQRSNEQLVKLVGIMQREESGAKGLSDRDRQNIFDSIREG